MNVNGLTQWVFQPITVLLRGASQVLLGVVQSETWKHLAALLSVLTGFLWRLQVCKSVFQPICIHYLLDATEVK